MQKRKRLSKAERKEQIIEHVSDLVAKKGFRSVSIREIAKAADINEALIYQHFSSKDELLTEIYIKFLSKSPKMQHIPETESEFIQMLSKFEEAFLSKNMKEPNVLKTLVYATLDGYELPAEFSPEQEGTFLNWLNKCITKGKNEWGYVKSIRNEVYISIFMGSMQHYIIQNSVSGMFKTQNEELDGVFTRMFIKSLKK